MARGKLANFKGKQAGKFKKGGGRKRKPAAKAKPRKRANAAQLRLLRRHARYPFGGGP